MRLVIFTLLLCLCTQGADPNRDKWISVADRLIQTPPESFPFNWGEGVQQIGLMKIHERTRDARYVDYMQRWTNLYIGQDVKTLLNIGGEKHAGYCGHWSPATAILYLHLAKPDPKYKALVERVVEFILNGAERSSEGALGHWQGSHQLWVDTLYMACPLLTGAGKHFRRPELITDSARQIITYSKHLQDADTGLYYHMWDWKTGERTPGPWGRGNGWVLMSIADTMEHMDKRDPLFAELRQIAVKLVAGLERTRDKQALWHTVLDDTASYPETSASCMVVYGLLKLIRLGVLPRSYSALAIETWNSVNQRFVKDGLVTGVSAGTVPKGREYYRNLPAGTETWGTGAYLMAGSEVDRLSK